ncbi:MAG: lipoprotein [Azoarcus sp.]|jgi:predicted small lipoprotein YifL|nr:lipoprotein [Azoarcus sp.]
MRATIAVTALVCVLLLSACGIKGPLYLPPVPTEEGDRPAGNGHRSDEATLPVPDKDAMIRP